MLRLKQAINECGIQQQALVKATGFSKTQVSLTLKNATLPANAEKFKDGVVALVRQEPKLGAWLTERNLNVERLFEEDGDSKKQAVPRKPNLSAMIYTLAGQAEIDGGLSRGRALRLVKALHLLSLTALPQVLAAAAAILDGRPGHEIDGQRVA